MLRPASAFNPTTRRPALPAGLLRLPEITAALPQQGLQVDATRGCTAFVERPVEQQEAVV